MIDNQVIKRRQMERKYLIDIIKCLKFLSRQGIPLQGHDNNDNLTQTLLLLGTKYDNITKHIHGQIGHKYTYNEIQNELLTSFHPMYYAQNYPLFVNENSCQSWLTKEQ